MAQTITGMKLPAIPEEKKLSELIERRVQETKKDVPPDEERRDAADRRALRGPAVRPAA